MWEGEPELAWELLRPGGPALFASHHVAGYSQASKQSATRMIQGALARRLGVPAPKDTREDAAPRPALRPALDGCAGPMDALARCLRASCDLLGDDRRTRALLERPAETRARAFEALRRGYDLRREPGQLALDDALLARLRPWLARPIFPGGAPLLDALAAVGFWREP